MLKLKILPVRKNHFGDQYMKLLKIHILNKQNYFKTNLNQYKNNPNKPQKIPNKIKVDFKNGYGKGVVFTSGCDNPKGIR